MLKIILGLVVLVGARGMMFASSPLAAAAIPLSETEAAIGKACMASFRSAGPVTPACSCFARRTLTGLNDDERGYLLERLENAYGDLGAPNLPWSTAAVSAEKVSTRMTSATRECDSGKTGIL